jgi:hopanoid biosynthesis associated RND transporter like protein HpnN
MNRISEWTHLILEKLSEICFKRPSLFIVLGFLIAASSAYLVVTGLVVVNNTNALIREGSEFHQNFLNFKKEFDYEEDYVITIRSEDPDQNRRVADAIGARMRKIEGIERVWCRMNFDRLKNRFLFYLSEEELKGIDLDIQGYVQAIKSGGFKMDLNSMLSKANASFQEEYLRKEENWKEFKPFIDRFIEMLNQLGDQLEDKKAVPAPSLNAQSNDKAKMKLEDMEKQLEENAYASLDGGKLVMVLARPKRVDLDAAAPFTQTVASIRQSLIEVRAQYPQVKIALTGEPVVMDDELITSGEDSLRSGILSFVLVALLMFFSYRQRTRPVFVLLVLLMGTVGSLGYAVIGVGHLNMISQAFVAMVIGLGVDFGIQIMGRYEEELSQGKFVNQAIKGALVNTGYAVTTGALTTAIAFYTMCFNDFIGLSEFGNIAGTGILICLFGALAVLPSIFALQDRRRSPAVLKENALKSTWTSGEKVSAVLLGSPRVVVGITVLITIFLTCFVSKVTFDHNLLNLQNQNLESVQEVRRLTDNNEKSVIYGVVVAQDLAEARAKARLFSEKPSVREVQSLAVMIPENQESKLPLIRSIVGRLQSVKLETDVSKKVDVARARRELKEFLAKCKEGEKQAKNYTLISSQAREAVEIFGKLIPPLERSLKLLDKMSQDEVGRRLNRYQVEVFGSMQKGLSWLKGHATDRGIVVGDLPDELQKRFISSNGRLAMEIYPKENVWNREANVRFVSDLRSVDPKATGTPVQNYEYIEVLRKSYMEAAVWAFVAILILMTIHFQRISSILMALSPLLVAVLWTLGIMGVFHIPFNPANIVTLPLMIGIGVAFGIYVVDRYQETGSVDFFSNSTGKSILLSGMTTMIGFGALMISRYRGMYDIGFLMFLSVGLCLVTSLVLLPAFLKALKSK